MGSNAVLTGVVVVGLLWLAVPQPVPAAKEEPRLSVAYEPPRLSVEARGVSITEILQAIGAKVGFAVVATGVGREPLTISLKNATLDTVLRQLLRPENYVLMYREEDGGKTASRIETIVLLGPAAPGGMSPDAGAGRQAQSGYPVIPQNDATYPRSYGVPPVEQPMAPLPMTTPPADPGRTRSRRASEQAAPAPRVNETNPPVAGAPAGAHQPIPAGAPDPALVQDQILQHVRTMIDAMRRATLDTPRGNRTP